MIKEHFFTDVQYLIMLIIAHICADFIFQTKEMADGKQFGNSKMFWHIVIVFFSAVILTLSWWIPLIITVIHYAIDSLKKSANDKWTTHPFRIFILDQTAHLVVIFISWSIYFKKLSFNQDYIERILKHTDYFIIALGYAIVIWPAAYVIRKGVDYLSVKSGITPSINPAVPNTDGSNNENVYRGGMFIGQFERIIILTFVLLGQYEAIGFLITGKSIIRFKESDKLQTEYVLFGTMLSYAIAIVIGVMVKKLSGIA